MTHKDNCTTPIIITAGSTYLDIDAYACCVAMEELLRLKGINAIAYSNAPCNYSVVQSLIKQGQIKETLPSDWSKDDFKYIIVDVSDPNYLEKSIPLDNVFAVYDHHVGFEEYWTSRIGTKAHIEFIGAAATLIYREWRKSGLYDKMSVDTAKLLVAAILDNTLNLTSAIKTDDDKEAFNELCLKANIGKDWCASYFVEVQGSIEADLRNALFGDVKTICDNPVLPPYMGQISIWNVASVINRIREISEWFDSEYDCWMLNIIDIQHNCNYFVCDSLEHQTKIEKLFDVKFKQGIAKTSISYLRKEIIKRTVF
ncbi:MAG: DHH family protein [Ruminococcaceae bacterium]|nr:DHH family protein [Oscillospiraceae bacterium]